MSDYKEEIWKFGLKSLWRDVVPFYDEKCHLYKFLEIYPPLGVTPALEPRLKVEQRES
jgi:hypothetical protein